MFLASLWSNTMCSYFCSCRTLVWACLGRCKRLSTFMWRTKVDKGVFFNYFHIIFGYSVVCWMPKLSIPPAWSSKDFFFFVPTSSTLWFELLLTILVFSRGAADLDAGAWPAKPSPQSAIFVIIFSPLVGDPFFSLSCTFGVQLSALGIICTCCIACEEQLSRMLKGNAWEGESFLT